MTSPGGASSEARSTERRAPPHPGTFHQCVVKDDALYCWGRNKFGQLGDQTTDDRSIVITTS